jgi:hypothetical protein
MTPQTQDPSALYGKNVDDAGIVAYIAAVDPATSFKDEDGESSWYSESGGLELRVDGQTRRVTTVHLFSGRGDGSRYAHCLPHGLDFDMLRTQVVAVLGKPQHTGPEHDSWETGPFVLCVQYMPDGQIDTISIFG